MDFQAPHATSLLIFVPRIDPGWEYTFGYPHAEFCAGCLILHSLAFHFSRNNNPATASKQSFDYENLLRANHKFSSYPKLIYLNEVMNTSKTIQHSVAFISGI